MKKIIILFASIAMFSCSSHQVSTSSEKEKINSILNNWHKAAAEAKFDDYFNLLSEESIYIGTDATENWNKKEFQNFAKPYFDKGKAWSFKAIERNIYFSKDQKMIWFDELLDTQMKICRGSGIMILENNQWKIKHYVLSMTIPNDNVDEVVKIKSIIEDKILLENKTVKTN